MKMGKSDITAKILTLVIAIFLWSYVMSETNPEITQEYRNIKVNYTNTAGLNRQGLVIKEPEEVKINVKVSGKRSDMTNFSASSIYAQIDLSGYNEGQVKIPITVGLLDQTSGIRIVNHEPKEVLFSFDRIISREIPVEISYNGELPEDYIIGDVVIRPQIILISGPRTWINEVDKAQAIVDLTDKTEDFTVSTSIKIIDDTGEEVRGVEKEPGFVDVTVPVFRTIELPVELVTSNELPDNYAIADIKINPETVVVKGDSSVAQLSEIKTVEVDINSILDSESMEVDLNLPEGVTLLNPLQRITITYNIREVVTGTLEFSFEDIEILNLQEGLEIEPGTLQQTFVVQLTGYDLDMQDIGLEDLKISVDLENYEAGEYQVEINMEETENLTIDNIEPPVAQITIIEE